MERQLEQFQKLQQLQFIRFKRVEERFSGWGGQAKSSGSSPLVAVAAEDGVPGRRVLADLPAGAAVVVGAAAVADEIIGWLLEARPVFIGRL